MRKISIFVSTAVAIYLLAAPLALAQGGNPPASTKESGATSGHGMTAVEQTGKGGNAEQQIRALQTQLTQAQLKGDTSFFEKNYADNATIVHSDGKLSSKAQEIANLRSGALKYDAVDVRELKINVYGETAVVDGLSSLQRGDQRQVIQWRIPHHSGLGEAEGQLEVCRVSGDASDIREPVSVFASEREFGMLTTPMLGLAPAICAVHRPYSRSHLASDGQPTRA